MQPSRFLKEIPAKFLQNLSSVSKAFSSVEEDFDEEGFSVGDEVVHSQFGTGIVQNTNHGSFGLTYEVHFPESDTTRTLVAEIR